MTFVKETFEPKVLKQPTNAGRLSGGQLNILVYASRLQRLSETNFFYELKMKIAVSLLFSKDWTGRWNIFLLRKLF